MLTYLTQNAIWWIEYANLDGLRVDTYPYNDKNGIAKWTKAIMDEYPNFNIVGEVWMYQPAQIAYWQKNSAIGAIHSYNSNLPSVMDFTLQTAITAALSEEKATWDKGLIKLYDSFANDFLYPNINNLLIFAENHDTPRFNQIYPNLQDYKLAMTLLATARGIPQLYYGSEIGMKGEKNISDGDIRRDFPGGWPSDNRSAFTKQGRTEIENAYHDFTAKLFNWRKNKKIIHSGKTTHFIPEQNTYVYFRHDESEAVMVILNNSAEPQTLQTKRFNQELHGAPSGLEIITNENINLQNSITIPAKSSMIIEFNKQP
jgi:glycosidase